MIAKIRQFLRIDIWRIRVKKLPKRKSFLIRTLRIFLLSLREFGNHQCSLRASALTFFTLLSIVPIFALLFGIAKGFGLESYLQQKILDLKSQEEILIQLINFSQTLLENTKGGLVAGVGVVFLFWTAIKLLGNAEEAFNEIWGVKEQRNLGRKISDYLSLLVILPVLMIASSGMTVFISTQIQNLTVHFRLLGYVGPTILILLKLLPYVLLWILLTFIYIFMPNTKVSFSSGLLGGIIAGTIYQLAQLLYVNSQIYLGNYGAVYGSFAALPLFLIWLQLSWTIILYGAEISFAHQNEMTYEYEQESADVSLRFKKELTLFITYTCAKKFLEGQKPCAAADISNHTDIPIRVIRSIIHDLVRANILVEVHQNDEKEKAYHPARDVHSLTIMDILTALEEVGNSDIPLEAGEFKRIEKHLAVLNQALKSSKDNVPIINL